MNAEQNQAGNRAITGNRIRAGRRLQTSASRAHTLIRAGIRTGDISLEEQLLEEPLGRALGMSRNAIRQALQMLVAEGLISRSPRRGTEVIDDILEFGLLDSGKKTGTLPSSRGRSSIRRIEHRRVPAHGFIARKLDYHGNLPIPMVEYVICFGGRPAALRVSYNHPEIDEDAYARNVLSFMGDHEFDLHRPRMTQAKSMKEIYGTTLDRVETAVEAQLCDARTSRLLEMGIGDPLLVRETLMIDSLGQPRDLNYVSYVGHRVVLSHASLYGDGDDQDA